MCPGRRPDAGLAPSWGLEVVGHTQGSTGGWREASSLSCPQPLCQWLLGPELPVRTPSASGKTSPKPSWFPGPQAPAPGYFLGGPTTRPASASLDSRASPKADLCLSSISGCEDRTEIKKQSLFPSHKSENRLKEAEQPA